MHFRVDLLLVQNSRSKGLPSEGGTIASRGSRSCLEGVGVDFLAALSPPQNNTRAKGMRKGIDRNVLIGSEFSQ